VFDKINNNTIVNSFKQISESLRQVTDKCVRRISCRSIHSNSIWWTV